MLDCLLPSFCSLGFARLEGENDSPNEFFIKLVMDSASAIGYTPFSADKHDHFLTTRDRLDAISLQDSRARGWISPLSPRLGRAAGFRTS
jgi:hypothetical protein